MEVSISIRLNYQKPEAHMNWKKYSKNMAARPKEPTRIWPVDQKNFLYGDEY